MTADYLVGPGWVASATVERAIEFIHARAGLPITVVEVAAWANVTVFALRYSFQQHFGTTPEGYLRRIRLERAHQDLSNADPTSDINAADVARRWGWASLSQFPSPTCDDSATCPAAAHRTETTRATPLRGQADPPECPMACRISGDASGERTCPVHRRPRRQAGDVGNSRNGMTVSPCTE